MSDDGFDFGPPPPRREVRRFEPPPWEREQFERHAREQAELEKASREKQEAIQRAAAAGAGEGLGEDAVGTATADQESGSSREAKPEEAPEGRPDESATESCPKAQVDDKQVAMMMLELRTEEPPTMTGVWMVILGAGVVVGLVGLVVAIWGVVALVRLGKTGALGGSVLLVFGLTFAGIGGGLIFKALRQRGVL